MRKVFLLTITILSSLAVVAQTPLVKDDRSISTQISPYYFGPNAFPVPEMLDGTVSHDLRIELDAEHHFGFRGDHTGDIFLKLNIPLFTKRVNLSAWMTVVEWYRNTDESLEACRLTDSELEFPEVRRGNAIGDAYVSADVQVLLEKKYVPAVTLRAVLKTASDDSYHLGRYYDSPGYFFDAAVGKSFKLGAGHSLRLAASTGFLCWQTNNGRQNDAIMFGGLIRWGMKAFTVTGSFCGYTGWEHTMSGNPELAHDQPMVVRAQFGYRIKRFEIGATYQYGVKDYPYHLAKIGVAYNIDILKKRNK